MERCTFTDHPHYGRIYTCECAFGLAGHEHSGHGHPGARHGRAHRPSRQDAEYDIPVYEFDHYRDRRHGHGRGHGRGHGHHREYESEWGRPERSERSFAQRGPCEREAERYTEAELEHIAARIERLKQESRARMFAKREAELDYTEAEIERDKRRRRARVFAQRQARERGYDRGWRSPDTSERGFPRRGGHARQGKPDGERREPSGEDASRAQPDSPPLKPFSDSSSYGNTFWSSPGSSYEAKKSKNTRGNNKRNNPPGANKPKNPPGGNKPKNFRGGNKYQNPPGGNKHKYPFGGSTYGKPRTEVVDHYKTLGIPFGANTKE